MATQTVFDPFDFAFHEDPYPVYEKLRSECPAYYNPERQLWALSRFDDVQAALRDHATFSSGQGASVEADHEMRMFLPPSGNFVDLDPPRHDELRGAIREFFAPRAMSEHEPRIRDVVRMAITDLVRKEQGDLVTDFAQRVPVTVICQLLGVPVDEGPGMAHLAEVMHARRPGDDRLNAAGVDAGFQLNGIFRELIKARRVEPKADVVTHLTQVQIDGVFLQDDEIIGIVFLVFLAGHDTTTQLIAHALKHLETDRHWQAKLRAEPALIPQAVEEFVRHDSPVSMLARTTTRDVSIDGIVIPAGSRVLMMYGSANRDESRFEKADQLDLSRPVKRHVAFGEGIHHCIGAPLARLEARVAIEEFLQAVSSYQFLAPPEVHHFTGLHGFTSLPVEVHASEAHATI